MPGNESRFTSSFFYILGEQNKLLNLLLSQAKTGGTVNPACAYPSICYPARPPTTGNSKRRIHFFLLPLHSSTSCSLALQRDSNTPDAKPSPAGLNPVMFSPLLASAPHGNNVVASFSTDCSVSHSQMLEVTSSFTATAPFRLLSVTNWQPSKLWKPSYNIMRRGG